MLIFSKLKEIRNLLNLKQIDIINETGLSQRDVSQLENGEKKFIPTVYIQFLNKKNIPLDLLYDDTVSVDSFLDACKKNAQANAQANAQESRKNEEITPTIKQSNEVETISLFGAVSRTIDIPIVEISAAASYGAINPDNASPIGVIRLPESMVKQGTHYCIRIKGESMSPTLQDSDYLIIRRIEPQDWLYMPDEHVFVVVDRDGMAYVKRVKNRLKKGFIVLMSDNIDKAQYKNFNLQGDEIYNIFHAEWHFSAKMQNINDSYYNRLKSLEDTVTEQGDILKKVLKSIEKK